jgi:Flp pilus assembly protein TadG
VNRTRRQGRGLMVVELAAMMPVIVAGMFFIVAAGRFAWAYVKVHAAAPGEARIASLQRTGAGASSLVARDVSGEQQAPCTTWSAKVDTSQFHPDGSVTVTIECRITVADLSLLQLPGAITVSDAFTEQVDAFR